MTPASDRPNVPSWLRPAVFGPLLVLTGGLVSAYFAVYRLPSADEGALLTNAAKILRGGLFYRDIDAYPFPGATYLLAGGMALFGEDMLIGRAIAAIAYCAVLASLYACALRLIDPARAAIFGLALLAMKFVASPSFTVFAYWDVAFAFACGSIALLLRPSGRRRLLAAGVLAGLALISKQNVGIYLGGCAGLLLLLPRSALAPSASDTGTRVANAATFASGLLSPLVVMAAFFASHGLLGRMFVSGLVRPFTGYLPTSGVSFLPPLAWWQFGELRGIPASSYSIEPVWILLVHESVSSAFRDRLFWGIEELCVRLIYSSIPLAFAWALVRLRRRRAEDDGRILAFAALAFAVVLSAFPRADFPHVIAVYPVVLLLIAALVGRRAPIVVALPTALAGLGACIALTLLFHGQFTRRTDLPSARVYDRADTWMESVSRFVAEEIAEGEPFFVYSVEANYYFLAGRFSPWPFSQLYPGQSGGDRGRALERLLRRDPPRLVVRGLQGRPGLPPLASYTGELEEWLMHHYERDLRVFERYPLPEGVEPPPWWIVSVLRPCREPPPACESFAKFLASDPEDSPFRPAQRRPERRPPRRPPRLTDPGASP